MKDNVFPVNERAREDVKRNLEELRRICECSIRIRDKEKKLELYPYFEIELDGENEKVDMAKKHLFEVIIREMGERYEYEECTGYVSCFLPFTPEDIKIFLADSELKCLQNCYGIVIIKEADARFPTPIMVRGTPDSINQFTKSLTTKIEQHKQRNPEVARTMQFTVQDIKWLMSQNGEKVKHIEEQTNAKCTTDNKTYFGYRTLTITGKFNEVAEAKKTINNLIDKHQMEQKIESSSKHQSHDEQGNRDYRKTYSHKQSSSKRFTDNDNRDYYHKRRGYKHRDRERSSEERRHEDHDRVSREDERDNHYSRRNHRDKHLEKRHRQYRPYD
ncbi:unnamed protein product [Caenorhabditis brenneri]